MWDNGGLFRCQLNARSVLVSLSVFLLQALGGPLSLALPVRLAALAAFGVASGVWLWRKRRCLSWPYGARRLGLALGLLAVTVALAADQRLALAAYWYALLYFILYWLLSSSGAARRLNPAAMCNGAWPLLLLVIPEVARRGLAVQARGLLGNPNLSAYSVAVLLPLGLAWAERSKTRRQFLPAAAWLALAVTNLIAYRSIGATAAAVVGVLVWVMLNVYSMKAYTLGLAALLPALLWSSVVIFLWRGDSVPLSFGQKIAGWQVAGQIFAARPLVGIGPRGYGAWWLAAPRLDHLKAINHAHNLIAQAAAEAGILGLGALALTLSVVVGRLRRAYADDRPQAAAVVASVAALGAGQITDFTLWVPAIVGLGLALLCMARPLPVSAPLYRPGSRRLTSPLWVAVTLSGLLVIGAGWSLRAEIPAHTALQAANNGEWGRAADGYALAAARDPDLIAYENLRADALLLPRPGPSCVTTADQWGILTTAQHIATARGSVLTETYRRPVFDCPVLRPAVQ